MTRQARVSPKSLKFSPIISVLLSSYLYIPSHHSSEVHKTEINKNRYLLDNVYHLTIDSWLVGLNLGHCIYIHWTMDIVHAGREAIL